MNYDLEQFKGKPLPQPAPIIDELVFEVKRLRRELERAEAVAREAVLIKFLSRVTWLADGESAFPSFCDGRAYRCISCGHSKFEIGAEGHAVGCEWVEARGLLKDASPAGTALLKRLERLVELETQVADLRGALQAALSPLEAAADALVPPRARVEEAAGLVEEAIEAVREELEE